MAQSIRVLSILFLILSLISFPTLTRAEYPGVTPGSFSVSDSGSSNYTLPISVPAGVAGMSPDLAVMYNSSGGNGLMGVGFNLGGFASSIHRCGGSHASDGQASGVMYTYTDKLCLDGQRLILSEGTHWGEGAVYHTEMESFAQIIYKNGNFLIKSRDGTRTYYDWRVTVAGPKTARWLKSSEKDRSGNSIHYTYQHLDGELWIPKEVTWGTKTRATATRKVAFEYQTRPDKRISYQRGLGSHHKHRINRIKTYIDSELVKDYRFTYQKSPVSELTRLRYAQQCGADGGCLPRHEFTWKDTDSGFTGDASYRLPVHIFDYQTLTLNTSLKFNIEMQRGDFIDVNNDGYVDFIESYRDHHGNSIRRIWKNTGSGWVNTGTAPPFPTRVYHLIGTNPQQLEIVQEAIFADVNGDGYVDIVRSYNRSTTQLREVWLNDKTGFTWSKSSTFVPPTAIGNYNHLDKGREIKLGHLVDVNGDGRPDWVVSFINKFGTGYRWTFLNTGSRWIRNTNYDLPVGAYLDDYRTTQNVQLSVKRAEFVDLNGDGLEDLIQAFISPDTGIEKSKPYRHVWLNTGSGWEHSNYYNLPDYIHDYTRLNVIKPDGSYGPNLVQRRGDFIDVNGDGLVDWVRAYLDAQNQTRYRYTWLNTGKGWTPAPGYTLAGAVIRDYKSDHGVQLPGAFMDINRDGLIDWVVAYVHRNGKIYKHTAINTGSGWRIDNDYKFVSPIINNNINLKKSPMRYGAILDVNGDSAVDYIRSVKTRTGSVVVAGVLGDAKPADMLHTITDSLDAVTTIRYKSMMDTSVYLPGVSDYSYRNRKIIGPTPLVSDTWQSDGLGDTYRLQYFYRYGVSDGRRGYMGFGERRVWDPKRKLFTRKTFYQTFPVAGIVEHQSVFKSGGITPTGEISGKYQIFNSQYNFIKRVSSFAAQGTIAETQDRIIHPSGKVTYAPRVRRSVTIERELGISTPIRSVWTDTEYDAFLNSITVRVVTVPNVGSAYENIDLTNSFHTLTQTTFDNDEAQWLIGMPTGVKVTHHVPGQADQVRETQMTYNTIGLPEDTIIEPNRSNYTLRTQNVYTDGFGNVNETRVYAGDSSGPRRSTMTYDDQGLHLISKTNALGHGMTITPDPICDAPASTTDANGLVTSFTYDQFCRQTRTDHPDGTWATTAYGGNPLRIINNAKGQPQVISYYDELGREIKVETEGFDGRTVAVEKRYNDKGQITQESLPYYVGETVYWTRFYYDAIGRLDRTQAPDTTNTTITYNGLTTMTTNALGQTHTQVKDIIGRLQRVIDADGKALNYSYDAVGNLLTTQDPDTNTITMGYDHVGRKISMDDPDMGQWTYDYDVLGQLIEQTDAKNQQITTEYDRLGRLEQRTTAEGVSTWDYDSATKGIGKLAITETKNLRNEVIYAREHSYDGLSRPIQTIETIGGISLTSQVGYDSHGRVGWTQYPGHGGQIEIDYTSKGYVSRVYHDTQVNGQMQTVDLWVPQAMDALGNITEEHYGNGVNISRQYHQTRHYVTDIDSLLGSTVIQDLEYTMDAIGNLTRRRDDYQNVTELFDYDNLNRLTQAVTRPFSAANRVEVNYDYDAIGNIIYRSDVGMMNYGGNGYGPHALTSIQPNQAVPVPENVYNPYGDYHYDENGNLTSNGQRTVDWTSFNKPKIMAGIVNNEARSVEYEYGSDFQRIRKATLNDEKVTLYYGGGTMEHITENSQTFYKYYLPIGSSTLEIKYEQVVNNGTPTFTEIEKQYLFKDHIGSTDVIVGNDGTLIERLSFNPWGERRDADWSEADGEIASSSNRGFTGHEMDDEIGLINMNARIYDPVVGRFLSPDSIIPSATDLQTYNRYSYVRNNPLSFTDPSGHVRVPGRGCGNGCFYDYEGGSFYKEKTYRLDWNGSTELASYCGRGDGCSWKTDRTKITDPGLINQLRARIGVYVEIVENYGGVSRGNAKETRNKYRAQAAAELAVNGQTQQYSDLTNRAAAANEIYLDLKKKARKRYTRTAFKVVMAALTANAIGGLELVASQAAVANGSAALILSGGDPKSALIAAATGGLGAGAEAAGISANVAKGLAGGLNGLAQGGGLEGFLRGAGASFIPGASKSGPFVNFATGILSDGAKGYAICGSKCAKNNIYGGLANDAIGHGVGLIASGGQLPDFINGAYLYNGSLFGGDGIAIGNVITIDAQAAYEYGGQQYLGEVLSHEFGHVNNQSDLGPAYLPAHILGIGIGAATGTDSFLENRPFKPVCPYSTWCKN